MVMTNLAAAAHFQSLATNAVTKVVELLRLWNGRTTNLVLGAGAIHSAARLKSINAKHLSYVTQCLGMMMALLPHIRAALMSQLPAKQHTLLSEIDKIKREYQDHNEKVLNKFVSIIGGIVEHGLAPRIANTDFASRARNFPVENESEIQCCVFLEGVSSSTRKLHQVLISLLPPDHLQDVFSRIFAYLDEKIPSLFITAASTPNAQNNGSPSFQFPSTDDGKRRLILEVQHTTKTLNALKGVLPWDFTAATVLGRKMDYEIPVPSEVEPETTPESTETTPKEVETVNDNEVTSEEYTKVECDGKIEDKTEIVQGDTPESEDSAEVQSPTMLNGQVPGLPDTNGDSQKPNEPSSQAEEEGVETQPQSPTNGVG
jgi:vacuolar protein sorting-associated protein 54